MALIHPNPSSPAILPCHPPWPVPVCLGSTRNSEGLGPPGLRSDQARRSLALEKPGVGWGVYGSQCTKLPSGKLTSLWNITIYFVSFPMNSMVMFHSDVSVYQGVHPNTSNSRHGTLTDQLRHGRNCCNKNSVLHKKQRHGGYSIDSFGFTRILSWKILGRISQWIVRMPKIQRIA